ncbi:MAG TPA: hypothetical protein VGR13_03335 [Actinomycetota bacterium]|nr:hypothetical protein [Actinomycetota bacterium]
MAEVKAPTKRTRRRGEPAAVPPPTPPICSVAFCPLCAAVTAFGEARPDLLEHLLVAGREMLLAFRALIDARLDGSGEAPSKMERLTIE